MADAFMEKFNSLSERIKIGGADLTRKMSAGVTSMSGKMKELFQVPTPADKLVEEATAEHLDAPDWVKSINICDMVNDEQISGQDIVRALKKRLGFNHPQVQLLTLCLLETCIKNCDKMFSEVASEKMLDEMVRVIDDPMTAREVREKALKLIESWGESTEDLRYLPVFEETYKSLKLRGIHFPGRDAESLAPIFTPPQAQLSQPENSETLADSQDAATWEMDEDVTLEHAKEVFDVARNSMELLSTVLSSSPPQEVLKEELTSTLVEHCHQSQFSVQRVIERGGDNELLLFEALDVNDRLQQVLSKYAEMLSASALESNQLSEPALIPVGVMYEESSLVAAGENSLIRKSSAKASNFQSFQGEEAAMADLDDVIFGRAAGSSQASSQDGKTNKHDDLIAL